MTSRSDRLTYLEDRAAELQENIELLTVELRAVRREHDELRAGAARPSALVELSLTDAVAEVLRRQVGTLGPAEIAAALVVAGRPDPGRSVTGTLNSLERQGRAHKLGRGRWAFGSGSPAGMADSSNQ